MEEEQARTESEQVASWQEDHHLTCAELAHLLNVPINTIYYWVSRAEVPCLRFGRRTVRFSRRAIAHWMAERAVPTSSEGAR